MSPETIRKEFFYDPELGRLRRIRKTFGGLRSPTKNKSSCGYYLVQHKNQEYAEHRVIWAYFHGKWPDGVIDHIDRDRTNNRIENLRDVPNWLNLQNRDANKNSTTGVKGVFRYGAKWRYQFEFNGTRYQARGFKTIEEASQARDRAYELVSSVLVAA